MSTLHRHALVTVVAVLAAACALPGTPTRPEASPEARAAFEAARAQMASEPEAAAEGLRSLVRERPQSPLADDAALLLARLAREADDSAAARRWLRFAVERHPDGDRNDEARLRLARLELERGDPDAARDLLVRARFSRLDPRQRLEAFRILADSGRDGAERLRWLAAVRQATVEIQGPEAPAVEHVDREIDVLAASLPADDLDRAAGLLAPRVPAGRLRLRLAERALDAGDLSEARRQLERAERLEVSPRYGEAQARLAMRLELREQLAGEGELLPGFAQVAELPPPRTDGARGTLGVVLPLSGPFAEFGRSVLHGVLLAADVFEPPGGGGDRAAPSDAAGGPPSEARVRVLVRDSAGRPERAAAAVRELATRAEVSAVVGPLLSGESEAAASAAEEAGIPLLTLTTRSEVAAERPWVFRLRTSPADEVRRLVEHAWDRLDARRFAVLYPDDPYGRGMRDRFFEAVRERGGAVVGLAGYDPDATDFAEPIRRLIGYAFLTPGERRALREREEALRRARRLPDDEAARTREVLYRIAGPEGEPLPPVVDFDVLFVPDAHDNVVLVAPQLAFHEVGGVRLLGTADWLHPDLLRIARDHVRGAVIAAPFWEEADFPFVSGFVERFVATFGASPDVFAAHGFDAANLVFVQLAAGRAQRDEVRDGVLRARAYPGTSGVTTVLPDGNARKLPYLIGVGRGRFVPLD